MQIKIPLMMYLKLVKGRREQEMCLRGLHMIHLGCRKLSLFLLKQKFVNPVRYCSTAYLWLNMPSRKLSNCAVTLNPRQ